MLLHGITAPAGKGMVLEVHLDIQNPIPSFVDWLKSIGFENDPFLVFYPPQYTHHMTGRTRFSQKVLSSILPRIDAMVTSVIIEAQSLGINLYAEVELGRETTHFPEGAYSCAEGVLDEMMFRPSGQYGGAKADVHIEFESGTVPSTVREYLLEKHFYWVSTPSTARFPAEDIATLQTETYGDAKEVYDLLVAHPLRGCTGIHLEQKLSMRATGANLPMPEVVEVQRR